MEITRQPRRRSKRPTVTKATPSPVLPPVTANTGSAFIEPERRHAMICDAAYSLSERRGFCPGRELDDWLAAEDEIDRALTSGGSVNRCDS